MRNGRFYRQRMFALAIGCNGQRADRQRIRDAAMRDTKSITHFGPYHHLQFAIAFPLLHPDDAQPLTEVVFLYHGVDDPCCLTFHIKSLYSPLNLATLFSKNACTPSA